MKKIILSTLLFLLILSSNNLKAQFSMGGDGGSDRIEGKFKFIPLPYVDYNTSYGATLGALPMGMYNPFKKDTISPSSIGGLLGMYSENKSWFVMGFGLNYLMEDNWRVGYAFGFGDDNFQFYLNNPFNVWIPYTTHASFIYLDAKKRVISDLFLGASYLYTGLQTKTEYYENTNLLHGIGIEAAFDRRSNVSYPKSGYYADGYFLTYPKEFGNKIKSNQLILNYNTYFSVRNKKDVFAARAHLGVGIGDVDFNQQFIVGENDIRGYSKGEYRGNQLYSIQGEYRWNFYKKLGLVAFAGIATVQESINPEHDKLFLPGVGVGARYTYMKDTHSNFGFDVAKGRNDWSFSLRLSEAF